MANGRKSAYAHLLEYFHESPHGRLYEFLFWFSIGAGILVFTLVASLRDWMSEPFAWLLGIVGACFIAFSLLPHPKRHKHEAPLPKGKRGEIAKMVRASKAEKKKKGPPPPGPPIRRG